MRDERESKFCGERPARVVARKAAAGKKSLKRAAGRSAATGAFAGAANLHPTGMRTINKTGRARSSARVSMTLTPTPIPRPKRLIIHDGDRTPRFATFGALTAAERVEAIKRGLPASFFGEALDALQVTRAELLESLGIASSTAARVVQQYRPFSVADSERLSQLARLWGEVMMVFEDAAGARAWLTGYVPSAGGVPLHLLKNPEGFESALRAILQLAYGVPA